MITNIINNTIHNGYFTSTSTPLNGTISLQTTTTTYLPAEIVNIIALIIPCLTGTIGNILVIYIFAWKKRKHRKPFEALLSILAVVDLFASIVVPTLFLYAAITKYRRWDFGYVGCKLVSSFFPLSVTLSQGILVLISYERYRTIKDPFGVNGLPMQRSFIVIWLLVTLLVAMILVSPYVYVLELVSSTVYKIHTCMPSSRKQDTLLIYSIGNVLRDLTATASMIVLGLLSNRVLREKNTAMCCNDGNSSGETERRFQISRRQNLEKARGMLVVVVCVFSICVIPMDLFQFVVYMFYQVGFQFSQASYENILTCNSVLSVLQIMSSATNVFIYARMHKDFTARKFCKDTKKTLTRNISRVWNEIRVASDRKKEQQSSLLKVNVTDKYSDKRYIEKVTL